MTFAQLHPYAVEELARARRRARLRQAVHHAVGADDAGEVGWLDALSARYHAAIDSAEQLMHDAANAPGNFVREQVQKSADAFRDVAKQARDAGLESVREAATVAAASIKEWGAGFGDGWRSFWGMGPGTMLAGAGVLGLVVLGGGGYLLLTGGGQTLLAGAGTALAGVGKALIKAI